MVGNVEQARREILAGNVLVDEKPGVRGPAKPSDLVREEQTVRLRAAPSPFVSRGGLKLDAALTAFGVDPTGRVAVDLGASTGGFTDCLLQRGAVRVYAVDVGFNQLAWALRQDPRVVSLERTDARTVVLPEPVTLVVGDVSFIPLRLVLPAVARFLTTPGAEAVLLVKPQFEVAGPQLEPGGRLRNEPARQAAIARVLLQATEAGLTVRAVMDSPIPGMKAGNIEALVHLGAVSLPPAP